MDAQLKTLTVGTCLQMPKIPYKLFLSGFSIIELNIPGNENLYIAIHEAIQQ